MRYCLVAGMALLLAASSDSAALGGKKNKSKGGRGQQAGCGDNEIQMPPVCGARKRECGSCSSYPSCCAIGIEAIDIDSLTPAAQSKKLFEQSQVRIKFELPDDVGVYLLDRQMTTPGEKRSFLVPVPDQNKTFEYEIRVDAVRNGKKYFKKLKVKDFRAGMILMVKVESRKVAEGEPVVLKAEPTVEAPGGPPQADDSDGTDDANKDGVIKATQLPADPAPYERRVATAMKKPAN